MREFVEHLGILLICCHLETPTDHSPSVPIIPELARDRNSGSAFHPTSGCIRSCRVCFTDYQMKVKPKDPSSSWCAVQRPAEEGWVIEIDRWHKLGGCRSPHDLEWRNLVNRYDFGAVLRQDVCAAGMVRREWIGGDICPDDAIGETFVSGLPGQYWSL